MMAVIEADNGNKSLRETCQWNAYNEHGALHDGQGADVDVAKGLQAAVQDKSHQAFRAGHDERRYA